MSTESNYTRLETPIALVGYNNVSQPDEDGKFKLTLFFKNDDPFVKELGNLAEANVKYEESVNGASREVFGIFKNFSEYEKGLLNEHEYKKIVATTRMPINMFDANGNEIQYNRNIIPRLSQVRAHLAARSYTMKGRTGTTLYVSAVQIVKLEEGDTGSKSSKKSGFAAVKGGSFIGTPSETLNLDTLD